MPTGGHRRKRGGSRNRWLVWGLAGAAPGLVLFARILFLGETPVERDLLAYYRAGKTMLVRLWAESPGLPIWNPWFASGQPFAANPEHQVFHPLSALFFVFPFEWAFRLQVVLPVLLSGAGMGFLLVTLGRSRSAALFGALSWTWGGYLLSTVNLLPILHGVAAAPFLLAFLVRLVRVPSCGGVAGAAASAGWMALAGEPVLLMTMGLAALPALLAGLRTRRPPGVPGVPAAPLPRRAAALAAAAVLGLALGAGTLLPGSLLFRKTVRAEGLSDELAYTWSLPPVRLFELAAPRLLGHLKAPLHETYWGMPLYEREGGPFLLSIYPGLLVLAAAVAAWARRPSLEHAWAAVGLLGLLLAVGSHAPFWPLAREGLPILRAFRYPEKLALLAVLAVTVSGAAGFDLLRRGRRGPIAAFALVLALAGAAGAAMAASLLDLPRLFAGPGAAARFGSLARADGLALLAVAAGGLLALLVGVQRGRRAGGRLLLLVVGVDLTARGAPLLRSEPAARLDAPPPFVTRVLERQDPDGRVFHLAAWLVPRGDRSWLVAPPMPAYWGLKLTLESDFDLTELSWSHHATREVLEAIRKEPSLLPTILARRGVTAIVRPHPRAQVVEGGLRHPADLASPLDVAVSASRARPAFVARHVASARGAAEWLAAVRSLGPRAAEAAILHGAPPPAGPTGTGELLAFSSSPGRIGADVRCDGPGPCVLALTETWDEHWSARVGEREMEVLRADLSLMAVVVPPGRHRVALAYDDPSVRLGAALSALAALVVLALALAGRRRRASR